MDENRIPQDSSELLEFRKKTPDSAIFADFAENRQPYHILVGPKLT